jgi:hypothetical protein
MVPLSALVSDSKHAKVSFTIEGKPQEVQVETRLSADGRSARYYHTACVSESFVQMLSLYPHMFTVTARPDGGVSVDMKDGAKTISPIEPISEVPGLK